MGEYRDYRYIIPGAMIILAIFLILFAATVFQRNPMDLFPNFTNTSDQLIITIIALLVSSFAGGYICGTITICLAPRCLNMLNPIPRGYKLDQLRKATGIKEVDSRTVRNTVILCDYYFHSLASKGLMDWSTRRLSSVIISLNSIVAIILGIIISFTILFVNDDVNSIHSIVFPIVISLMLIILCYLLCCNAKEANYEHWTNYCNFVESLRQYILNKEHIDIFDARVSQGKKEPCSFNWKFSFWR